jgi:hypothetical protein
LDANHDDAPLHLRAVDDIIEPAVTLGFAAHVLDTDGGDQLFMISAEEPSSVAQAVQEAHWRRALEEELHTIEDNRTWTLTDLPPGRQSIGLKWVLKAKMDEQGAVVQHKARLVVKGYAHRQGIDFEEVFAPVACIEAVQLLLALAAYEVWQVHHMDLKIAFLNGDLQEVVYV